MKTLFNTAIRTILTLISLILIWSSLNAQERNQYIATAINLLSSNPKQLENYLQKKGYEFKGLDGPLRKYHKYDFYGKIGEFGFIIQNSKIKAIAWTEFANAIKTIPLEFESQGFQEVVISDKIKHVFDKDFISLNRNLRANMSLTPNSRTIMVTIGINNLNKPFISQKEYEAIFEAEEEKKRKIIEEQDKKEAFKLYEQIIKGLIVNNDILSKDKENLKSSIPNIDLLKINPVLEIDDRGFKVDYKLDSLINFLKVNFKNDDVFLTISKEGKLINIENETGNTSIESEYYPVLNDWINISGNFNLIIDRKLNPINYKYKAFSIRTYDCGIENNYYCSIGNKKIELLRDSTFIKSQKSIRELSFCSKNNILNFKTDQIGEELLKNLKFKNFHEIKKISNTTPKTSSTILKAGVTLATGIPIILTETDRNENIFKYSERIYRKAYQINDLKNQKEYQSFNILNKFYSLEVYNPKKKSFIKVK